MQHDIQSNPQHNIIIKHVRPGLLRMSHWLNAILILAMLLSGFGIYNGSPYFHFQFPEFLIIGSTVVESAQWHLALMWIFVTASLAYLIFGIFSGHFRRHFIWASRARLYADIKKALTFKLKYQPHSYNAIQRIAYSVVCILIVVLVLSGLALWQPVQFQVLTLLMGDYENTRTIHFVATSLLVSFMLIHLSMALAFPRAIWAMITGKFIHKQPMELPVKEEGLLSTEAGDGL